MEGSSAHHAILSILQNSAICFSGLADKGPLEPRRLGNTLVDSGLSRYGEPFLPSGPMIPFTAAPPA